MSPILTVLADYFGWLLILAGIAGLAVGAYRWARRAVDETLFPKEKRGRTTSSQR